MERKLRVKLIDWTPGLNKLVSESAGICYGESKIFDPCFDVNPEETEKKRRKRLKELKEMGHLSPFEHISFTYAIEGISRACSHQLVRHRIASYTQQSQRYVDMSDFDYIIPGSIKFTGEKSSIVNKKWFEEHMKQIQKWYDEMVSAGIPKEDARFILPNATETKIIVTMNARELLHFFSVRCCNNAQWEILAMAVEMLRLTRLTCPVIFDDAGPNCLREGCKEGKRSCGKQDDVKEFFDDLCCPEE